MKSNVETVKSGRTIMVEYLLQLALPNVADKREKQIVINFAEDLKKIKKFLRNP